MTLLRALMLLPALALIPMICNAGTHGGSNEADAVSAWLAPFQSMQVIRGEFEQQKKMPLFSKPFKSSGIFLSVRDRGLVWDTRLPAPSRLVMMSGQMVQTTGGRRQTFHATGTGYDGLALLLPALLDGDLERLGKYFTMSASGKRDGWTLTLSPKPDDLAGMIGSIKVLGADNVLTSVELTGAGGDTTTVRFLSFSSDSRQPDERERALFE